MSSREREFGPDELDDRIDAALARRFAAPDAAHLGALRSAAGASVVPVRAGTRARWLTYAAGLALAFGAGAWFAGQGEQPGAELPPAPAPPVAALTVSDCRLDDLFTRALAGDFEPHSSCELSDAELQASLDSPACEGTDELVVVGEWSDARFAADDIVMLRLGAEPVMLVLPSRDDDSKICLTSQSPLHLFRGCWRGRPIYELSALDESRVLSCVQALDVESARF
jgi:hypothetical protein